MTFYFYKSYDTASIFKPENLVIEPFLFPKSCKKFLGNEETPLIYIFDEIPSKEIIEEYKLKESLIMEEYESLDELKKELHKVKTWELIAMF